MYPGSPRMCRQRNRMMLAIQPWLGVELCSGFLRSGSLRSHQEIGRKRAFYEEELTKHGHSIEGRDIPMARRLAVGATHEEAEASAARGAQEKPPNSGRCRGRCSPQTTEPPTEPSCPGCKGQVPTPGAVLQRHVGRGQQLYSYGRVGVSGAPKPLFLGAAHSAPARRIQAFLVSGLGRTRPGNQGGVTAVSYTHLRAHATLR